MIGCGSMGGGMALLFAEDGIHVSLSDPAEEAMDGIIEKAENSGYHGRVSKYTGMPRSSSKALWLDHVPWTSCIAEMINRETQITRSSVTRSRNHASSSSHCLMGVLATKSSKV